ncbi:MAG: chemotaxis protein CheW, partial [Ignavibacteria bacterium]|nr:chemotaxis protein CheW [Ignavibacteria bacterium]
NKPEKGKLQIQIRQNLSQKIELLISDDGAGINKERLIKSAIKNGTTTAEELKKMSDNEIHMLIFASGISTKSFVTDISGRGLGMAIVAENVAKINGTIEIETKQGHGTTFTITLPQTMAAFRGIVVKSYEQLFVIPTSVVVRAIRIKPIDVKTVESKRVIQLNNETLSLVNLGDVLGLSQRRTERNRNSILKALVLQLSQKKIVFIIDELLGEHEGVVKNLSPQLKHVKNIAGATLLGNGKIVPILQIHELMESAAKTNITNNFVMETMTMTDKNDTGIQYILIAEDSITVRNMLRSFVETAGYKVKTAVDGSEAFDILQKEHFDLVVSDVEMPKMNGFELTARIKADRNLE